MQASWKQFLDKTSAPVDHGPPPRLPYEHDESQESVESAPRDNMLQAYRDLMNGLVDTDMHGYRGVEEVFRQNRLDAAAAQAPLAPATSDPH
jgi:hypothetical protein